jgi:hypothetical protein
MYLLGTHKVLLLPPMLLCSRLYHIPFRFMGLRMTRLMPFLAQLALAGCASLPKTESRLTSK